MNIKGKLVEIGETQQLTETFQKREFVIEFAENPEYPEFIKFELIKDKCALLYKLNNGDELDVYFNLKGRKWVDADKNVKYFNSLQAWKIDIVNNGLKNVSNDNSPQLGGNLNWKNEPLNNDDESDLPF